MNQFFRSISQHHANGTITGYYLKQVKDVNLIKLND